MVVCSVLEQKKRNRSGTSIFTQINIQSLQCVECNNSIKCCHSIKLITNWLFQEFSISSVSCVMELNLGPCIQRQCRKRVIWKPSTHQYIDPVDWVLGNDTSGSQVMVQIKHGSACKHHCKPLNDMSRCLKCCSGLLWSIVQCRGQNVPQCPLIEVIFFQYQHQVVQEHGCNHDWVMQERHSKARSCFQIPKDVEAWWYHGGLQIAHIILQCQGFNQALALMVTVLFPLTRNIIVITMYYACLSIICTSFLDCIL